MIRVLVEAGRNLRSAMGSKTNDLEQRIFNFNGSTAWPIENGL